MKNQLHEAIRNASLALHNITAQWQQNAPTEKDLMIAHDCMSVLNRAFMHLTALENGTPIFGSIEDDESTPKK